MKNEGLSSSAAGLKRRRGQTGREGRKEVKAVAVGLCVWDWERGKGEGTKIEAGGGCRERGECDDSRTNGWEEAADEGNSLRRTVEGESHKSWSLLSLLTTTLVYLE